MKKILPRKKRLEEFKTVALTQESRKYLLSKLPHKLEDPRSFTIPCTIGDHYTGRALCDLGALMSMSVFRKLGVGEARPTTITLQLSDRSLAHPEEKIEDVLVRVDKFILLADFIILDYEEDIDVLIILRRPFLAIEGAIIDVEEGELSMNMNGKKVKSNVLKSIEYPWEIEDCSWIDVIDCAIKVKLRKEKLKELLTTTIMENYEANNADVEECKNWLNTCS
ncbi:uncharacterized protein LOC133315367 [Gastrolobium bilobum]|uniref:uncharacterized protein LOC133315367 n=1 Tax=Gastrolobium bilobum TaxID=150636 RepID=UPI002AB1D4E2|nr:uncharacterized protein LOC133315367 [Gastrolobium bilobum]